MRKKIRTRKNGRGKGKRYPIRDWSADAQDAFAKEHIKADEARAKVHDRARKRRAREFPGTVDSKSK